jgi:alpha-D-xyloside xylohydrolase
MSHARALALLCVTGCGPSSVAPFTIGTTTDGVELHVKTAPFSLELARGGVTVARTADPALELGVLDPYSARFYPDPLDPQNTVKYSKVTNVVSALVNGKGDGYDLVAQTDDGRRTVAIAIAPEGGGSFTFSARPSPADAVVHVRLRFESAAGERYFGLGEYFDTFDQTGQKRDVRFVLDTTIESGYNEAHVPVPSYVTTTGFGLLLDNREPLVADLASAGPVELTVVAGAMAGHLVAAPDPVAAEARLQRIAGTPPMWPQWMFAPFQWRDDDPVTCTVPCDQGCKPSRTGQDIVLGDAAQMRAHKLPGSVIWIDAPWMTAFDDFNFNPVQFPDAKAMIAKLHEQGYHVMVWSAPFVNNADDTKTECGILPPPAGGLYTEMEKSGYFVKAGNGDPFLFPWRGSTGALCDFTNPDAFKFWKSLVKRTTDLGVVGYKMDWDEYIVSSIGTSRPDWKFADGSTPATQHAVLHELWHKAHQEALMEAGSPGFILARSGDATDAKYASAVWPGDLDNSFVTHRQPGAGSGLSFAGGLPAAVNAAVGLAASLHPHFGSDIGGLRHGLPNKELMARWSEFAALTTVMELGGGGVSHNVWDFSISDFDQELLDIYGKYARLHVSLFPYLYAYVRLNTDQGTPILRAPAMMYPADAELAKAAYEYFFGEDLLVAPVVVDQARKRDVTLPAGRWVNWWTREVVTGPSTVSVDAPLDRLPLFAKVGAVVPLLAPDVDTLAPATDPSVVTAEMRAGEMGVRVFPGQKRVFTLADGTKMTSEAVGGTWSLVVEGAPRTRRYTIEVLWSLVANSAPAAVTKKSGGMVMMVGSQMELDMLQEGAWYDATNGVLWVKVAEDGVSVK